MGKRKVFTARQRLVLIYHLLRLIGPREESLETKAVTVAKRGKRKDTRARGRKVRKSQAAREAVHRMNALGLTGLTKKRSPDSGPR